MTTLSTERDLEVARHTGNRINQLLWERRITKLAGADAMGVSGSTFSKKLRGTVPITVDELVRVAGLLRVSPGDLLPDAPTHRYERRALARVYDLVSIRAGRRQPLVDGESTITVVSA